MSKHLSPDIRVPIDRENPAIQRKEELCIKCGQCRDVCRDYISVLGYYDLAKTDDTAICVNCGQCANVCPVGSITENPEIGKVFKAIQDPEKVVIFTTSPSVRISLGEEFGMADGSFVQGKMVALLRELGADYVLDTNFAADLTIVEEASELIERVTKGNRPLPQFTSCCPAWVKFAETYYPEMIPHLSTAKSPIGMQGPTIKTYFANKMGIDPNQIVNVAVTPCTAKKFEVRRDEMKDAGELHGVAEMRDMDHVITTRELANWARYRFINFAGLQDSDYDSFMGHGSGAGVIFGNTGGVMEAAIRTAYEYITGNAAPRDLYKLEPVRGMDGIREASVRIGDLTLNVATIYGTANVRKFLTNMKTSGKEYHFIEVMTCPGGCIGGGGQPKGVQEKGEELLKQRIAGLYKRDEQLTDADRISHHNEEIITLYKEFYGAPLSNRAEKMLHTMYQDRSESLGDDAGKFKELIEFPSKDDAAGGATSGGRKWVCRICGYVHEGDLPPEECPICLKDASYFDEAK